VALLAILSSSELALSLKKTINLEQVLRLIARWTERTFWGVLGTNGDRITIPWMVLAKKKKRLISSRF